MHKLLLTLAIARAAAMPIPLVGSAAHHVFDGIGALSAGASSRLLYDYPEPQRSDVLDLLFKPNFGAGLQLLKVEIGGDAQSTDGSEASHMHTRDDLSCSRGYESWLIKEAKARNPAILTYGLSWATPRWVGDGAGNGTGFHSPDNWLYQTRWLQCMKNVTGYSIDWMGTWNEKIPGPPDYVTGLRAAFDAAGFTGTQISVYDGDWSTGDVVSDALADPAFAASFSSVGRHYPCVMPFPTVETAIHKKYWSSEDSSASNDWVGASCWARLLNRNYVYVRVCTAHTNNAPRNHALPPLPIPHRTT
jgi:galactosylceramidase